jgi:hypothetical protein
MDKDKPLPSKRALDRKKRQAAALKANLKRRKQAADSAKAAGNSPKD